METDGSIRIAKTLHQGAWDLSLGEPLPPPIVPASVYQLPGDPEGPYQYGRWSNPTWTRLEAALSQLEGAETVVFPSGMAAIAALFYTQLKSGDRVIIPADGYYTTRSLAETFLKPFGVVIELAETDRLSERQFDGIRLAIVETPSNPGLAIADIASVAGRAKQAGTLLIADNTTATPIGQRPLALGADAVISSDTKAIGGHGDALLGHVASSDPGLIKSLRSWRNLAGAIPGPFEAWIVHRGLMTLELRYERMCASASVIAERLQSHPRVTRVGYPGLMGHPGHAVARRQMAGFGFVIGMTLASKEAAERFIAETRFLQKATSFGGVQTSAERRQRWGDQVAPGFVRLSVGCEPVEVLWEDMRRVLDGLSP